MADSAPSTAAGWTHNAIREINTGELSDARQMLATAIRLDPDYAMAWIWFGSIATDDAERRYCYERAVEIDPNSVVAERLASLPPSVSRLPAELHDLEEPPLPVEFGGAPWDRLAHRRPWWPLALISALVLAALIGGIWFLWPRNEAGNGRPIYVAFVAGMSGTGSESAQEMKRGLDIYIDFANRSGDLAGRHIEIVPFDDADDPDKAASVAKQIVADGRFVAVIGHRLSSTSIAAAPIYAAAGIPMISPTATSDALTTSCDTCYRTVFDNSTQGKLMASYVLGIMGVKDAVVVAEDSSYGASLAAGFESVFTAAGGTLDAQYTLAADPAQAGDAIATTAKEIASKYQGKLVLLVAGESLAEPVLIELRVAGVHGTICGGDSLSSQQFLSATNASARSSGMGNVTTGLYASAPLFVDSLTGDAVRLAAKYLSEFGDQPTWRSFTSADAGVAIVAGLRSVSNWKDAPDVPSIRKALLAQWTALDSPEHSVPAFVGPLYFDTDRTAVRPVAIGIASGDFFDSAPRQIASAVSASSGNSNDQTIQVGSTSFTIQRVVQSGVDFSQIRDLNTVDQSFYADFFVWFKYFGDDNATDIVFTNNADPQTLTVNEVRSEEVDGMKYKVFRVTGVFTSLLDFHSFPFDSQHLPVNMQNQTLTSAQLVYSIDSDFSSIPQSERLASGGNATVPVNRINNWTANSLQAFASTVGTSSSLGDPNVQSASQGIEFSQIGVDIKISRQVGQYLLKNLLPLILLLAITYISLFFSHEQTTERVSFGITGVLTGAVLLSTVVSVLPDIGYTVAIEWAFYGFILLSALCILVALIGGRLNEAKQVSEMRILDRIAQIGYPVLVALVVVAYWIVFA